jgi:hypothetical protein
MAALSSRDYGGISGSIAPLSLKRLQGIAAINLGAFHDASPVLASVNESQFFYTAIFSATTLYVRAQVGEHNLAAARVALGNAETELGWVNSDVSRQDNVWAQMLIDTEAGNWRGVVEDNRAMTPLFARSPGLRSLAIAHQTPWVAYAEAQLGNFDRADAAITGTPADCYACLLMRARIREVEGKAAQAAWWFARADSWQPLIPFTDTDWGAMLLHKGDLDGAIAKFRLANHKGPHFADPLEMWGEALIRENRSDLALAKFAEADKYAPNWGHLHLKWGEALLWFGNKIEARKQFAIASGLDLMADEKFELVRMRVQHG